MQKILDNNDGTLNIGKSRYIIRQEPRGCREKVWIHDEDVNRQAINYRGSNCLIKFNRNDVSCENYGEVLYYAFSKSCGARCTKYELAELWQNLDGCKTKHDCVICPSYKHRPCEYEFSGYELQRYQYLSGSNDGMTNPNTIMSYINCVKELMCHPNEEMIRHIKLDLIKMAFFDYVTGQTDRHWENVSFIFRTEEMGGAMVESLRVASSYDNGCCFLFKRKEQALKTISNQLRVAKKLKNIDKYNEILENISKKTQPCMGIISSYYNPPETYEREYPVSLKPKHQNDWEQTFLNELGMAISSDEDLRKYFKNKELFKLNNARNILQEQGDVIPEELMYLANEIVDYRVAQVYKVLEKYLNKNEELSYLNIGEMDNAK